MGSDFALVTFNEELGDVPQDRPNIAGTTFKHFYSSQKSFNVPSGSTPTEPAYLLVEIAGVHTAGHKIIINGNEAGTVPKSRPNRWATHIVQIKAGHLQVGSNTIRFHQRSGSNDNWAIQTVAINWRT